jgi:hypothetical protein
MHAALINRQAWKTYADSNHRICICFLCWRLPLLRTRAILTGHSAKDLRAAIGFFGRRRRAQYLEQKEQDLVHFVSVL